MPARESFLVHKSLLLLGGLTIFAPLVEGGTTHLPVLIIRLVLLVAFMAWLLRSMKSGVITVERSPVLSVLAVFTVWTMLSVFRSVYTSAGVPWLLSLLSYAALLCLILQRVESIAHARVLATVVLGMGLGEAAVGMYQFMWGGEARPTGTFFNPNFYASYEVAVFSAAFGLLCFGRREDDVRWEQPLLWATAVGGIVAVLLAQSRGALLAFVAAVSFIGLHRFGRVFLGVLVLVFMVGALVPNPLQQRVVTIVEKDPYALTRLDIWKSSLERIADHPWGVGPGLYKFTSIQYRFPIENTISRYGKRAESAHSAYLQMAVELGVPGLALFLCGVALVIREIRRTMTCPLEPWERGLVVGLSGGIVGILVHGTVDSVFHEPALVMLGILFAGLIMVVRRFKQPGRVPFWTVPFAYHPARAVLVWSLGFLLTLAIIQPAAAWYAFDKGEGEAEAGRPAQALRWFRRATIVDPGTTAYRDALALAQTKLYYQTDDPQWLLQALEELVIGLDLNPLDGRLAHRLGTLHALLANRAEPGTHRGALLEKAAAYYEQAIRLDPYSPFQYLELGKVRWAEGRLDEAQALFRRATGYEPNFLPARVQAAELALKLGRQDEAAAEYAEIVRIKERYRAHVLSALERQYVEVESGHLKRALDAVGRP